MLCKDGVKFTITTNSLERLGLIDDDSDYVSCDVYNLQRSMMNYIHHPTSAIILQPEDDNGDLSYYDVCWWGHFSNCCWDELLPEKFWKYGIACLQLCIKIMTVKSFLLSIFSLHHTVLILPYCPRLFVARIEGVKTS